MKILEEYAGPLAKGTFLQRYKRFSVEVMMADAPVWAHCNNSGSMMGLLAKGNEVLLSVSANPNRKMPYTLEAIKAYGTWVGVNTLMPNKILKSAFAAGALPFAKGYAEFKSEVYLPAEWGAIEEGVKSVKESKSARLDATRLNSARLDAIRFDATRLDARLTGEGVPPLWIECKSVTLLKNEAALFPDAKTERGQKHLRALMEIVKQGERAACFYFVQRSDAAFFAPAEDIDAEYAKLLCEALAMGVEVYAFCWERWETGIGLGRQLSLRL